MEHEEAGQLLSAGRKHIRASIYYLSAERMLRLYIEVRNSSSSTM